MTPRLSVRGLPLPKSAQGNLVAPLPPEGGTRDRVGPPLLKGEAGEIAQSLHPENLNRGKKSSPSPVWVEK